jgi:hypothetical protein
VVLLGSSYRMDPAANEILLRDFRRVLGYGAFAVYVRT